MKTTNTVDEKIVNTSPQMLLYAMIGTFVVVGMVEGIHYSMDLFTHAGWVSAIIIGTFLAILLQTIRFALAMSAVKALAMDKMWNGIFGLLGSVALTVLALWEMQGLSQIWGEGDTTKTFGILLIGRGIAVAGLFLEIRYAILYKDMHE